MSDHEHWCLQTAVSWSDGYNFLGGEVRKMVFIWGPSYHPHEGKLGEGDHLCGAIAHD